MAKGSAELKKRPDTISVRTTANYKCWFISGKLFNLDVDCLIDTGASPNVLDWNTYEKLNVITKPVLQPVEACLQAAEGSSLKVYGQAEFDVCFGSQVFLVKFIVADLDQIQSILGMDFLSQTNCTIDAFHGILTTGSLKLNMKKQDDSENCLIHLVRSITIPGDCEHMIECSFDRSKWNSNAKYGLAEAVDSFAQKTGLMVTNAVVNVHHHSILLSCANFSSEPVTVHKGLAVAAIKQVRKVTSCNSKTQRDYPNKCLSDLPEYLHDMVSSTLENLPLEFHNQVCGMIFENQQYQYRYSQWP